MSAPGAMGATPRRAATAAISSVRPRLLRRRARPRRALIVPIAVMAAKGRAGRGIARALIVATAVARVAKALLAGISAVRRASRPDPM